MINNVFLNKRIATSLLFCWIIIFFAVEAGYAYYRVVDETEYLFFHREKASATWGKGEKYFALYDNFSFFFAKHHNEPIICYDSDNFVPADKIAFNLPVNITIKRSITPENLLTNLIYANLKLKKQVEEYEALQKRANELLKKLKIPFLESDKIFQQESDKKSSIYKEMQNLKQKHREIIRKLKSSAALHGNENLSAIGSTKFPAFLHSKQKTSKGSEPLDSFAHFKAETMTVDPAIMNEYNYGNRIKTSFDEDTSLPWIFKRLLNAVQYVVSHKIEVLLLLFSTIMFITILLSILRRRR
ncbi:MAG: hypothetical protein LWW97_02130 [Deltaproteobacteria bacterium]|nr:hypothetical protein [Deltaproteobacteria bacterium]